MKIVEDDPFFQVDLPVLRIRSSAPAETARRAERWARSKAQKLRRGLEAAARAERRTEQTVTADQEEEPTRLWSREVAAAWHSVRATFDGLFLDEDEEELARLAFSEGGSRWRVFLMTLVERKRDREAEVRRFYWKSAI